MRLIDADELEKVMAEDWFLENLAVQDTKSAIKKDIVNMIDSVPLAYDVDGVIKGLEKYKNFITIQARGFVQTAINIVKDGGING